MHFKIEQGLHIRPDNKLYNKLIRFEDSFKFLGLIFDSKLTWKAHISKLKAKCQRLVGMLKFISSHDWGGYIKTVLHLYRILIGSKLDYEFMVYQSASNTINSLLEPIANKCMRMATGAFKSTPVKSLNIIANETILEDRLQRLYVKYFYKMKSQLANPALEAMITRSSELLFQQKQLPAPFAIRTRKVMNTLELTAKNICSSFSYTLINITKPSWNSKGPNI